MSNHEVKLCGFIFFGALVLASGCASAPSYRRTDSEHGGSDRDQHAVSQCEVHVVIIHGAFGNPQENWIPWLVKKLNQGSMRGRLRVDIPTFPTPEGQTLDAWRAVLGRYVRPNESRLIMVGHSIGATMVLRALEAHERRIWGAVLVSPVSTPLGLNRFDEVNQTFVEAPFDWPTIAHRTAYGLIFQGSDDPYVPLISAQNVAMKTQWSLDVVEKGGHLNTKAGFVRFDALYMAIEKLIFAAKSREIERCHTS